MNYNDYSPLDARVAWEKALFAAQKNNVLDSGPVNLALRLATTILWKQRELRWSNDMAAEEIAVSRASFYRNIAFLIDEGFLSRKGNNYIAVLPESQSETIVHDGDSTVSHNETAGSQNETAESQSAHTYSADSCSADSYRAEEAVPSVSTALPPAAKPSRQPTAMEYFERHNPKAAAVADDRLPAAVTACIQNFGPEKTAVVLKGADRYWNSMAHDPEDFMDTILGDLAHGGTYNGPLGVQEMDTPDPAPSEQGSPERATSTATHDEYGYELLVA